jgi:hypothetical protein
LSHSTICHTTIPSYTTCTLVRVFFLDNSSKVFLLNAKTTSVKDLLQQCLEKLGIHNLDFVLPYFGIFESRNGGAIDGVLNLESMLQEALTAWTAAGCEKTAKFLFMIRLYLPSINGLTAKDQVAYKQGLEKIQLDDAKYLTSAELVDENVLHVQFMQAVYHVITGQYPTQPEEAIALGAIHFLMKFGKYRPETHKPGFLGNRVCEFVPVKCLKQAGTNLQDWETKLFSKVQEYSNSQLVPASSSSSSSSKRGNESDDEESSTSAGDGGLDRDFLFVDGNRKLPPIRKYMELIYRMKPIFGCTFFRVTQRCSRALPDTLYLGVYHEGIHLMDKSKKPLRVFYIEDIFRWGFKPNTMFYFEVNADNELGTGSLEFDTEKGKTISDLMTDYAMAFLKEREAEEERLSTLPPLTAAMSSLKVSGAGGSREPLSRGVNAHLYEGKSKEYRAAARIQALFRGFSLRNEWVREDAAILIQSIYRGYRARIFLSEMIEQMIQNGEL